MPGPIYLYVTGDDGGPDIFGLIYDNEDDAMECATDNGLEVWRVPFTPDLDAAVLLIREEEETFND